MTARIQIQDARKLGKHQIVATDTTGADWTLNHKFTVDSAELLRVLKKVQQGGTINPDLWTRVVYRR